jgi:hypothetical protein
MKSTKFFPLIFILIISSLSLVSLSFTTGGYDFDPTGDADGIGACDITRIDVEVDYHSHPVDDEIFLKITLAEEITLNRSQSFNWFDYNFYVDTSLSTNSNTSELTTEIYEYRAHIGRKFNNSTEVWTNTTTLTCTRYYYTGDGQGKTMGSYYWNPNTQAWVGSDPGIDFGEVVGNTVIWDVTGAIYREQPVGTGYLVQGVATTAYNLNVKDRCLESGWVHEFLNCCPIPSSGTNTPTLPFPSIGFLISMIFLGIAVTSVTMIRKRRK